MFSLCSYNRIRRLTNWGLSYALGSKYSEDLHKAVNTNDLRKIESLIVDDGMCIDLLGWDPSESKPDYSPLYEKKETKVTPLHLAARNGSLDAANILLKKGANPNQPSTEHYGKYWTPFHYALYYGHYLIAEAMIKSHNITIDEKTINMVKEYGLVGALPLINNHHEDKLSEEFIAEVHKRFYEIKAINWFCKEKKIEAKGIDSEHSQYFRSRSNLDPFSKLKAMQALEYSVLESETRLVEGLLEFKEYFKYEINASIYDIEKYRINERIKKKFPKFCENLQNNAYDIDGGVSYYIPVENTRKAPILFVAILVGQKNLEVIKILIRHGANVNATVNNISALTLMNQIFGKEVSEGLMQQSKHYEPALHFRLSPKPFF